MSGNANTDILLAGAVAAFTVDLLVYPLDTLKTRLQSPDYKRLYVNESTKTVNRALFRGVYQGVGSVIVATLPSSGAFFTTYEGAKTLLHDLASQSPTAAPLLPQPLLHAAASALAELVSCAILTPAEVIKQNAQMVRCDLNAPLSSATWQTMARFRSNPLGLWRGYGALAGRNLPFTALQFPLFEQMKDAIKKYRDESGTRTGTVIETGCITALSAGTAGSFAAVVTTPVDVIKTRIMLAAGDDGRDTEGKSGRPGRTARVRKSSWAVGKEIVAEHGVKGLYRGGALRGVWTMLGSGLYLGVYESGLNYLAKRRGLTLDQEELL